MNEPASNSKPRRRWFQFSLRTLFVLVTLFGLGTGAWVQSRLDWIRQRRALLPSITDDDGSIMYVDDEPKRCWEPGTKVAAPAALRLLGEPGAYSIRLVRGTDESDRAFDARLHRTRSLFPEADVWVQAPAGNYWQEDKFPNAQ